MTRLLSTTCLGLMLAAGPALAQSLDDFAAQARAAMPQAAPVPLDQLLGPEAGEALPELADLLQPQAAVAPGGAIELDAVLLGELGLAQAQPLGTFDTPAEVIPAQAQTPADEGGAEMIQPTEPPAGWVWHEIQGTRFAAPGDMRVMEQDDDNLALFRGTMEPPTGVILVVGLSDSSDDTFEEMIDDIGSAAEDGIEIFGTGAIQFPDGRAFDWIEMAMTDDGIEMHSRMFFSRDLYGEHERALLVAAGQVGSGERMDEATRAAFLASLRLGPSVPRPEQDEQDEQDDPYGGYTYIPQPSVMQPALGGLVTVPVPDGWTFTTEADAATLTAPGGIGTIRFSRGAEAQVAAAAVPRGISMTSTWLADGMVRQYELGSGATLVWETCPAPGQPLAMVATGAPGFTEDPGYAAVLSWLRVTMPPGAMACGMEIEPQGAPSAGAGAQPSAGTGLTQEIAGVTLTLPDGWEALFTDVKDAIFGTTDNRLSLYVTWQPAGTPMVEPETVYSTTSGILGGEAVTLSLSQGNRAAVVAVVDRPREDGLHFMMMLYSAEVDPATLQAELLRLGEGIDWGGTLVQAQQQVPPAAGPETQATPAGADPDSFTDLGGGYTTYRNGRYGMEISYPGSYFTAAEPPGNGDGRSFEAVDGQARFLVFSQYDALDQGLEGMLADSRMGLDSVTSEDMGPGFFSIAGLRGTEQVFRKVIRDADGLTRTFEIAYPAARAEEFRAVVAYMADSFGPPPVLAVQVPQPPQTVAVPQPPTQIAVPQPPATAAAGNRVTDFADGTAHGWTGLRASLMPQATGGPDGRGHLENFSPGDGDDGFYIAPASFLGDWSALSTVEVTIRRAAGSYYGALGPGGGDLILYNGEMRASTGYDRQVGTDWDTYRVPLEEGRWALSGGATSLGQVLANVTEFLVRGEFNAGDTRGSLARVAVLGAPTDPSAIPTAVAASGLAGDWRINANGSTGRLTFRDGPTGLEAELNLGLNEPMQDLTFDPATGEISFFRERGVQHYIGTLDGNRFDGLFNQGVGSAYTYNWFAEAPEGWTPARPISRAALMTSDFGTGTDLGWVPIYSRVTPQPTGGPDGRGHLEIFAPGDGEEGAIAAPDRYHGDWTGLTTVEVVLRTVPGDYFGDIGPTGSDLILRNGAMTARAGFDRQVGTAWDTYRVPLVEGRWTLGGGATSLAQVLANVTDFRVRDEYNIGDTTAYIARIAVLEGSAGAAPAPQGAIQKATGVWSILTSTGYRGRLTIAWGPDGLAGYVNFDALGRDEILRDVAFDPATGVLTFFRPDANQEFRATIRGDSLDGAYSAPGGAFPSTFSGTRTERDDFVPEEAIPQQGDAPATMMQPGGGAPVIAGPVSVGPLSTPARGTAERSALMDAARGPIQELLGVPVIFVVSVLNTDGTWAYLQATPVNPDGTQIDWNRTPFGRDINEGFMSDVAMVLMRREGGQWRVLSYFFGPTDVAWYDWMQDYGLPERLFTN